MVCSKVIDERMAEEIDSGADCIIIVGKICLSGGIWVAIARLVIDEYVLEPPPRQDRALVESYIEPDSGKRKFILSCEPGFATSKILIAFDWDDGCDEFMRLSEEKGIFVVELIYRGKLVRFMTNYGEIDFWKETDLSDDNFALYRDGFFSTLPEEALRRSKGVAVS